MIKLLLKFVNKNLRLWLIVIFFLLFDSFLEIYWFYLRYFYTFVISLSKYCREYKNIVFHKILIISNLEIYQSTIIFSISVLFIYVNVHSIDGRGRKRHVYCDTIKYRYNNLYKFFLLLQPSPLLCARSKKS